MELTKKHMLMLLFLSPHNRLLQRIHALKPDEDAKPFGKDAVQDITGVSRQTPENWRHGKAMRHGRADSVFMRVLAHLKSAERRAQQGSQFDDREFDELRKAVETVMHRYQRDEVDLFEISLLLGIHIEKCQQLLSAAIHDSRPLLPGAWLPPPPKSRFETDYAKREADRYEGVYLLWIVQGDAVLQCPLHVCYLQTVGKARFIRCLLNVPDVVSDTPARHLQFEGFLAVSEQKLFWTFERRDDRCSDYFHLITEVPTLPVTQRFEIKGEYLTAHLSNRVGQLRMQRLFSDSSEQAQRRYQDVMQTYAKVLTDGAEIRCIRKQWE